MTLKIEIKTIAGKEYKMVFCKKCEVWIPLENYDIKTGEHTNCEEYQKTKEMRKRASDKITKIFNRLIEKSILKKVDKIEGD